MFDNAIVIGKYSSASNKKLYQASKFETNPTIQYQITKRIDQINNPIIAILILPIQDSWCSALFWKTVLRKRVIWKKSRKRRYVNSQAKNRNTIASQPRLPPLAKQKFQINSPSVTRIQRIMRDSFIEKKITLKKLPNNTGSFYFTKKHPMQRGKIMCVFTVVWPYQRVVSE